MKVIACALVILLVLRIELSEASHRRTVEAIETRKGIVVRTIVVVVVTLLSLNLIRVAATLGAVAIKALTLLHFGFGIMVESLLFHERGKSVDGAGFVFQLVSRNVEVELPVFEHESIVSILEGSVIWKEIIAG